MRRSRWRNLPRTPPVPRIESRSDIVLLFFSAAFSCPFENLNPPGEHFSSFLILPKIPKGLCLWFLGWVVRVPDMDLFPCPASLPIACPLHHRHALFGRNLPLIPATQKARRF